MQTIDNNRLNDEEFLDEYNKDLDESEAQIDAGDYYTQDEVKKILANRKKQLFV